ncbi:MAG: hypothetical protein ACSLFM_13175 [Tepidiformaceae bacterium]
MLLLVGCLWAAGPSSARADYTPSSHYEPELGAGGTYVSNDGTNLSATDLANSWNGWTGYNQLVVGTSNDCGTSVSCIILVGDGETITGTNCTVPNLDSGIYAQTFLTASGGNLCTGLSSVSYPIYVVVYNDEGGYGSTTRQHIQRHEAGHALRLADATVECWYDGGWLPLMNNSLEAACAGYPNNVTATNHEAYYAALWAYLS